MKKIMEGSHAVALAVKQSDVKVISAYPITPSTHIVEKLSEYVDFGEMDAEFIRVESEFSALSGCIGTAASGIRTFTATASQGLALMTELLPVASVMRLPIVMAVGNRALSAPINIWNDHSDIMIQRDNGWIQLFCSDVQEMYDFTILAYKIAESVKIPVIVNFDGFYLTHVYEPLEIEKDQKVKEFLGEYAPDDNILDPEKPITMGPLGDPNWYNIFRKEFYKELVESKEYIKKAFDSFYKEFGRKYNLVKEYGNGDCAIVALGSITGTLREAAKQTGWSVIDLKVYRPFPREELYNLLKNKEKVIVLEKHISYGNVPPIYSEIKELMYHSGIEIKSVVAGLGGKDIRKSELIDIMKNGFNEDILWL